MGWTDGLGGRLDELERNNELLSPRRWLICRVGAARRQSQTKLWPVFHEASRNGRSRLAGPRLPVRLSISREFRVTAEAKMVGVGLLKIDRQDRGSEAGPRRMAS